jgi:starch phosphorylase
MKPIQTFSVVPALPTAIEALRELAYNLRWSWSHQTIELFRHLDSELWERSGHNPVWMLGSIEQEKLEAAAKDDAFLHHLRRVAGDLESYLTTPAWFERRYGQEADKPSIAYFSAEFGLTECLSIAAGGLGILAGDHLKSGSDLGLPIVGVGLLYQQGYFLQRLNQSGWQQEVYEANDFHNLPLSLVCNPGSKPLVVQVEYGSRPVFAQVWRAQVGRVPLYLLDTNFDANANEEDRSITDHLYGGDRELRIRQEILLGIGGYRALQALGLNPTVYHMNEGHSAFLALERVRHLMQTRRLSFAEARELASASLVFTTHTPVEAGHDYFSSEQISRPFDGYAAKLGLSPQEFLALGRAAAHSGDFCMTVLALRLASRANAVSKLHGEISRRMWNGLWPELPASEVPIRHITNGVHLRSWISLEMNQLYDRYLGPHWRDEPANSDVWSRVWAVPPEELWSTHERRRERLVSWARRRVREQRVRRGAPQSEVLGADEILDPDALTIGFARRFATYKRATLVLRDLPRLRAMMEDPRRPIQLIFAGKAHPRDEAGKQLIREVTALTRDPELGRRIVFLENYDMAVARYLVQGVDVWLNTPRRPNEASGTSGMKAAANGALNVSIPDGWWDEVWCCPECDPRIGWAIGKGELYEDLAYQDQVEAEALYDILERDIVPVFYDRGRDRIPRRWIERMKASISSLCKFVNTHRMVNEYLCRMYMEAHRHMRALDANDAAQTRALAAWIARVRADWHQARIEAIEDGLAGSLPVGARARVRARVRLGPLSPADIAVELYFGRLDSAGEITDAQITLMQPEGRDSRGAYVFSGDAPCARSGLHGYTVRLRPARSDLPVPMLPGLICWAGPGVRTGERARPVEAGKSG